MNKQAKTLLLGLLFLLSISHTSHAYIVTQGVDTTPADTDVVGLVRPGDTTFRKATIAKINNHQLLCYDLYITTPGGSVEPTGSNPPPAFRSFSSNFTISQIYMLAYAAGAGNAVVNSGFATDTIWTKGAGWTIDTANNQAVATGAISTSLSETPAHALTPTWPYVVTYTVSGRTAGSVAIVVGGTSGTSRSTNGTFTQTITSGNGTDIAFTGSGFTGNVSAVSVTSYPVVDVQDNGISVFDANRMRIDNSVQDSRNNVVNAQPVIVLPTVLNKDILSVVVIKDDDQNAMAGGEVVVCGRNI